MCYTYLTLCCARLRSVWRTSDVLIHARQAVPIPAGCADAYGAHIRQGSLCQALAQLRSCSAIPMSSESPDAGPSNVKQRRAPRGSACLNCKKRKHVRASLLQLDHHTLTPCQKCDGGRPVCGPCIRSRRETECEYLDGPRPSRKQLLEEQIARLQERVEELEASGRGSTPILARDSPVSPPTSPCQYCSPRIDALADSS